MSRDTPPDGQDAIAENAVMTLLRDLRTSFRSMDEKLDRGLGELRDSLKIHDRDLAKVPVLEKRADDHEARLRVLEQAQGDHRLSSATLNTRVAIYGAIGATAATSVMGAVIATIAYALTHLHP
jgi:hypothetical protein